MQNLITDKATAIATITAQGVDFDLSTLCHTLRDDEQVVRLALISSTTNLTHASKRLRRDTTILRLANHLRNLATFVSCETFKESKRPTMYPLFVRAFVFQQARLSDTKLYDPITTDVFHDYNEAKEHYETAKHCTARDDDRFAQSKALYELRMRIDSDEAYNTFFDENELASEADLALAIFNNGTNWETDSYHEFDYTQNTDTTFNEADCNEIIIQIN